MSNQNTIDLKFQITPKQEMFIKATEDEVLFGGAAGGGKLEKISNLVVTPFGMKPIGDIKAGDVVSNPRTGGVSTVIIAHPIVEADVWEVEFEDGTIIECHGEHLWTYRCSGKRSKSCDREKEFGLNDEWLGGYKVGRTIDLQEIVERAEKQCDDGKRPNWVNIPVPRPVEFTTKPGVPVDPYLLGVLIGDGSLSGHCPFITKPDVGLIEKCRGIAIEAGDDIEHRRRYDYAITGGNIKAGLKKLGIWEHRSWEKFIPKEYKYKPLHVRSALMQGLMETDGYVDSRGHMSYCTTSKQLAIDVKRLANSLGAYAKITVKEKPTYTHNGEKKVGRVAYTVWIKPHYPEMFVGRGPKAERVIAQQMQPVLNVVEVRKTERRELMRCITVDTKDGLYITSEDFIVTHNSFGQLIDNIYKAYQYPGIRQLILRQSFPELEKSLIRVALDKYPKELYKYNMQSHTMTFNNGSVTDFGFLQSYADTKKYQSAEYDIIRFDEATHFDEDTYVYMQSRNRGANRFPKQVKSSTNPGHIGHKFFRKRFIDGHEPMESFTDVDGNTFLFIPSLVTENYFLMAADPKYIERLKKLPEAEREALLNGRWDAYSGLAFPEWDYSTHTCEPFQIPEHWRKWISVDNGYTDPFYWGWYAVSPDGIVYLYREYTREYDDPKVLYTEQAARVNELMTHAEFDENRDLVNKSEKIDFIVAGVDAWNKHHRDQSGKDLIDMYSDGGLSGFVKCINDRRLGKSVIHEYLKPLGVHPITDEPYSRLQIFRNCPTIIRDLPDLIEDSKDPEKYADCTWDHSADQLRYSLISYHANFSRDPIPEKPLLARMKEKAMRKNHRRRRYS